MTRATWLTAAALALLVRRLLTDDPSPAAVDPIKDQVVWETLSERRPRASLAPSFLSPTEAAAVLALAGCGPGRPRAPFQPTPIVHPIKDQGSLVVRQVRRRLSAYLGLGLGHFEPLFVLEYRPGMRCDIGQSTPHFDWNCEGSGANVTQDPLDGAVACPQLRLVTSIIYLSSALNDGVTGGRTVLPRAGISAAPRVGACLAWFNAGTDGLKDDGAQHYGECLRRLSEGDGADLGVEESARRGDEAEAAVKFVAVQWVRRSPYDFSYLDDDTRGHCEEDPEHCDSLRSLRAAVIEEEDGGALRSRHAPDEL